MRTFLRKYIAALLFISFCQVGTAQDFLKVSGQRIINGKDSNYILRGIGLGGYMLQEGYMLRLSFLGQQYKISEKITEMAGVDEAAAFYDNWLKYNTQKADIDSLASWGFNSVRLPMHYDLFTLPVNKEPVKGQNTWLETGFNMVDSLLTWCKANKIYLILDLHAAPGGQGNDLPISDRNPDEPSLWQSPENQEKTIALWKKLAEKYAAEPYIGGYDILNETNWGFDDADDKRGISEKHNVPLKDFFIRLTNAIRSVDKNHIIYLEGNGFANNYQGMFPLWDDNLVVSFHKYGNFTTKETIQNFLNYRQKYNVPLWLGESGENSNTWYTNTIALMEHNDIGWCWWPLKKMGINNPLEIKQPLYYNHFLDFCTGKRTAISPDTARMILHELINNVKIENNIFHKDVTDAMFRQVNSTQTLPFKRHFLKETLKIDAVDFDLGRNGYSYNDKDTASYMYTPGVNTQGNRGRTYRNDGVDIKNDEQNQPYVFDIENGEWLQYTLDVQIAGNYELRLVAAADSIGVIEIFNNGIKSTGKISIQPSRPAGKFIKSAPANVHLQAGSNKLRIYFSKGGFNLKSLELNRKK
jgi:endoglucanase